MIIQPDLRGTALAFLRRKVLFVLVTCAVCAGGGVYLLLKQPQYMSSASLVVRFEHNTSPNIDRNTNPTPQLGSNERREIIYSDADILRSPDIIRAVINEIGLPRIYPAIADGPARGDRKIDDALELFKANLVVDVGLQSDVINVTYLNPDAVVARDAVQMLLDKFYGQEATVYANPQLRFATEEATKARDALTSAQNGLAAFKSSNNIADLQQQVAHLLTQRTDVESRLGVAHGRVAEAEQRQAALTLLLKQLPTNVTASAYGEQYRTVDQAETQLDALLAKRSRMASTYRSDSPLFGPLDAEISALQAAARTRTAEARSRAASLPNVVHQNINTDLLRASAEADSAREPERVLAAQLADINHRLSDLEGQRNKYDDMVRAVQIQNDTYRTLAIRYETARVDANRNAEKISAAAVIAAPAVAIRPARPRRKLVALASALAGIILAAACVLAVEAIDDRLWMPRDVVQTLRLPVLATFSGER